MATPDNYTALDNIMKAISDVETRGYTGDAKYAVVGKPNKKGQKAYGKYQVMDFNVPTWTKQATGKALTPKQFLANPDAQEAVARQQMGQLYQKYGNVADVSSSWFTGQPVATAGNVKDVNGTTNQQYVAAVSAAIPSSVGGDIAAVVPKVSNFILNAYHNLFGVNKDLNYVRPDTQQKAPTPVAQAPAPQLVRKFTPNGRITTPFGGSTSQEGFHPGVDIAAPKGTPISSTVGGVVTSADYGHIKGENNFGNSVTVKDANGDTHRFSHMNNGYVKVGQPVSPGQPIGEIGDTGATYSPSGGDSSNLDYRISTAYGQYKNPMLYLKNQG